MTEEPDPVDTPADLPWCMVLHGPALRRLLFITCLSVAICTIFLLAAFYLIVDDCDATEVFTGFVIFVLLLWTGFLLYECAVYREYRLREQETDNQMTV